MNTGLETGTATTAATAFALEPAAFGQMAGAWKRNRHLVPLEMLEPYRDRYIAWNPQVDRIIASAEQFEEVVAAVETAGYDVALCPIEFVG